MKNLRVTLVQVALHWENPTANRKHLEKLLSGTRKGTTDLIAFPEMFTTGFSMNAVKLAETMRGPTIAWMKDLARAKGAVVCGSIIAKEKGRYYNRFVWMKADGKYETYDKRHLFSIGGEQAVYTAGTKKFRARLNGWDVCPLVCYDLRFPVWSRRRRSQPCDLLLYVASWPARRSYAWRQLLIARAIENQCYVAGVNRTGRDGNRVDHQGDTVALDPLGMPVGKHKGAKPFVETVTLSGRHLEQVRKRLPFQRDADQFIIM